MLLATLVVASMLLSPMPLGLMLASDPTAPPATASGVPPGGESRGVLPSDESFSQTRYRSVDTDNNSKKDSIEVEYTVQTTALQEPVSVLAQAQDGDGNTVKFVYDNFTALRIGNQGRSWTFNAYYSGFYRIRLTLYDSQDRKEDTDNSGVFYLDTGTSKQWISIKTTSLDMDKDSYKDDVEVHVTNSTGKDVSGAQVWINGSKVGSTNSSGRIISKDYPEGWTNIDAFSGRLHNSTSWYSEGDGAVTGGYTVRAEPFDSDGDDLEDDVDVTVRNQLGLPAVGVSVTINGTSYGNTDAQGQVTAYNFRRGWWTVNASRLNNFGSTRFFSEGQGPGTDKDEYFYDWEVEVVDVDGDDRENDLRVRFDVDVDPPVVSNVTVWANLTWSTNMTAAYNASLNFTTNGTKTDWQNITFRNITYGIYWLRLLLIDEYNNTEDWQFDRIQVVRPSNHVNVETGVYHDDSAVSMDDVLFQANRVDEGEPNITIRLFNETGAQVRSAKTRNDGHRWFRDLADGIFNWTARDEDGRLVERGRVVIGARVQVETLLSDLDNDGFFDDFRVRAYNNLDRAAATVTVTVWAPNGTEVTSNLTLAGQLRAMNLTKGTYEFNATYLGEELANGTFYSYGNVDERFTIYAYPKARDLDGDGRYDDLNVTVLDTDDNPMEFAKVYVDGVYKTLTDLNGHAIIRNLAWGIHDVEAHYTGEVAKAQFFSEGTTAHKAKWTMLVVARDERRLDELAPHGSTNDSLVLYYAESTRARPIASHLWLVLGSGTQELDITRLGKGFKEGGVYELDDKGVLHGLLSLAFGHLEADRTAFVPLVSYYEEDDGPFAYYRALEDETKDLGERLDLLFEEGRAYFTVNAYELRSVADWVASSNGDSSLKIGKLAERVTGSPSIAPDVAAKAMIDASVPDFDEHILLDMSKMPAYITAFKSLFSSLEGAYPDEGWAIQDARNVSGFGEIKETSVNATTWGEELASRLASSSIAAEATAFKNAAASLGAYLTSVLGPQVVVINASDEWEDEDVQEFINASELARDTKWDEFMEEFWRFRNFGIEVHATAFDADSSGRDNDVSIYVNDTYGRAISGASVSVDRVYRGTTNATGHLEGYNFTRGVHLVNVTWQGYEAETSFTSEGTVVPNVAPSVSISQPDEDDTVNRTYVIRGTSSDPDGFVSYVQVRFNGSAWQRCNGRATWTYSWNTRDYSDGDWLIEARAYDGDLYSQVVKVNVTVLNPVEYADILLVDDDGGQGYDLWFAESLTSGGYEFDVIRVARGDDGPAAGRLKRAKHVIWLTGEESEDTLTAADVAALTDFLDSGGNLWLSGQDIGRDLTDDGQVSSSFLHDYLRADFVHDNADDWTLIGVNGEEISEGVNVTISGGTGAMNQNYPSEIQPRDGASVIYLYNSTAEAAVKYGTNTFKTVYFAFGFEAISSNSDRDRVLENVLDWLENGQPTQPNELPVADAGNDVVTMVGEVARLRGTGTDPDGLVALYEWDFDGDGTYDWSNETTGIATHVYEDEGNYTARLRVRDNIGDFATDTVDVEVRPRPPNQPPIADAGEDLTVVQGDLVTFLMAGNDPDGAITLYEWDYEGDGVYDEESTYPVSTEVTYYKVGVYNATLRVTDDEGANDTDVRVVTVEELVQNKPPVADAGPDVSGVAGTPVALMGSGADPDGNVVFYSWDFDGDGDYEWNSTVTGFTTHTYEKEGSYVARLLVKDNDGASHTDSTNVTIEAQHVNQPPVAQAPDVTIIEATKGVEVVLEGNGSDPDGFIVLYEWDFENDGTYDWESSQNGRARWTYTATGLFVAKLRVTDNDNATAEDTVRVNVRESTVTNKPPTADAGGPYEGKAGESIVLEGSGSDPENEIKSFEWDFEGDGTYDDVNPVTGRATAIYETAGTYTAVLRVTDKGGLSTTDSAQVTITAANERPTVSITSPVANDVLSGYVVFRGTASDDGGVARVEVRVDGGAWTKASGTTGWTYDYDVGGLVEGAHTLQAKAFDADGAASDLAEVSFVIEGQDRDEEESPGFGAALALLAALGAASIASLERSRRRG